jgi:hypothetical protein
MGQLFGGYGAQAVRGNAEPIAVGQQWSTRVEQAGETVEIVDETTLAGRGRGAAEIAVRIEDREQGQADAGGVGGGAYADPAEMAAIRAAISAGSA